MFFILFRFDAWLALALVFICRWWCLAFFDNNIESFVRQRASKPGPPSAKIYKSTVTMSRPLKWQERTNLSKFYVHKHRWTCVCTYLFVCLFSLLLLSFFTATIACDSYYSYQYLHIKRSTWTAYRTHEKNKTTAIATTTDGWLAEEKKEQITYYERKKAVSYFFNCRAS